MKTRPTRDQWCMSLAGLIAMRSTCSRLNVGALATRDGQLLAAGYNGAPSGMPHCVHKDLEPCRRSVHAEVNVIASAAKYGVSLQSASLYVTHSPCLSCAGLLINAGIRSVMYMHDFRDTSGLELLQEAGVGIMQYSLLDSAGDING